MAALLRNVFFFFNRNASIAENVPILKSVCFWLGCNSSHVSTWAHILIVLKWASPSSFATRLCDKMCFNMAACNCLHLQIGRQTWFHVQNEENKKRWRESNKQRINGKIYRFDYLHFYFANWITFASGIRWQNSIRCLLIRSNQMSSDKQSSDIQRFRTNWIILFCRVSLQTRTMFKIELSN